MKKHLPFLICLALGSIQVNAQLAKMTNDTFYFDNDAPLDYIIAPTRNDSITDSYSIIQTKFISGNSFTTAILVSDNTKIRITDGDTSSYTGVFKYTIIHNSNSKLDTAIITFIKSKLADDVRPGDVNNDGIVNHIDLLPIGIKYGTYGSPRHIKDTNTGFVPKSAGNWLVATRNVNDKFIDINGDGIIDTTDSKLLHVNFGKSWKASTSLNSPPSFNTILSAKLPQDTIDFSSGKISLPVRIENQSILQSYGISFAYQLSYLNKTTGADSVYRNNTSVSNFNLWNDKPLLFFRNDGDNCYVAAVKTNGKNGSSDGYAGVVEIVVDVIIAGIAKVGDIGRFKIDFKDILLVDNAHTPMEITGKPYTFYVRKVSSAIQNNTQLEAIKLYPNPVDNTITIEKSSSWKIENYRIYNAMGQCIASGVLKLDMTTISDISWPSGVYYFKTDSSPASIKIRKQ